jgi:D-alanine-D-alanine ligase
MRIGLIYDTFDAYSWPEDAPPDADAEYEPPETIDTLAAAVEHLGHVPVRVGTAFDLRDQLGDGLPLDAAINIAEGTHSRNREAYAPILLEMADIPCVGSDALTLSVTLDKAWTKDLADAADVPTPPHCVYSAPEEVIPEELPAFPLFVKPRYEGTSKGITPQSKVGNVAALRREVERVTTTYAQDAVAETFVGGTGTTNCAGPSPQRSKTNSKHSPCASSTLLTATILHGLTSGSTPKASRGFWKSTRSPPLPRTTRSPSSPS